MYFKMAGRTKRLPALEVWRQTSKDESCSSDAFPSPWSITCSELCANSGEREVVAMANSTVEVVISVLVDGEKKSGETSSVLKPESQAHERKS
jgi:hypothetical protein